MRVSIKSEKRWQESIEKILAFLPSYGSGIKTDEK